MYCPLTSFQKEHRNETSCMGDGCILFNDYHGCTIAAALLTYININAPKENGYHYDDDDDFDFLDRCD